MFRIALCDDEAAELDKLEHMLLSWSGQHMECEFSVERFLDADEMLCRILEEGYSRICCCLTFIYRAGRGWMRQGNFGKWEKDAGLFLLRHRKSMRWRRLA